jgi:hypothetical protein
MRAFRQAVLALSLIVATTGVAATQQPPATATSKQPPKPLTLSGCVSASPKENGVFTLSDAKEGTTYRLVGSDDVREFVGQHVQVAGSAPRRVQIVGGLYPSPNVAAQAGAIDPGQAAVAAASEPAAGTRPLEFRVKSVRATPGVCPEP